MLAARIFNRIHPTEITAALHRLGLRPGDRILLLVSLRSTGYIVGGPGVLIDAVCDVIGPKGSLMMPAFPAMTPLPDIPADGVFDEEETQSAAGLMSEIFRRREGVSRSLHPVGSMIATGPLAREWLDGHEKSSTPFGANTPIDRLVASGGRILAIGTHTGPILPYLQERASYPFLYEAGDHEILVRKKGGPPAKVRASRFRGPSCQVVILQGDRPETRDYVLMRDYALVFPADRTEAIDRGGFLRQNRGRLLGRLDRLKQRQVLSTDTIGRADAALIEARAFCDLVVADLSWEVTRFKEEYDPERLDLLGIS